MTRCAVKRGSQNSSETIVTSTPFICTGNTTWYELTCTSAVTVFYCIAREFEWATARGKGDAHRSSCWILMQPTRYNGSSRLSPRSRTSTQRVHSASPVYRRLAAGSGRLTTATERCG